MYEAKRLFNLPEEKPAWSQIYVDIDITDFLGTETIQSVVFTASCEDTGADATTVVLDQARCTYDGTVLKPFVQAGKAGYTYLVEMRVTTVEGTQESFFVRFDVTAYWEPNRLSCGLDAILYAV
jgi:hypothetical protein